MIWFGSIKIVTRVIENQRKITGIPNIDLMRVQKEQEDKINSHLVVIKNFSFPYKKEQKAFEQAIQKHENYCFCKEQASNDEYPQKNSYISFKSYQKQQQLPFFITADFEPLIDKISEEEEEEIDDKFQGLTDKKNIQYLDHQLSASYCRFLDLLPIKKLLHVTFI
ncbi:hypothetical protein ABPG72_016529 [Tetrahymena utriculariae]